MTPRVLLTGGTGFIGRQAVRPLREAGFEVHALGRRSVADAVWHNVDLLDAAAVAGAVGGVRATHMLHLAWDVTPGRYWTAPANLDWLAASLGIYRAFVQAGGRRLTVAGSCAEYDWTSPVLDETTTALRPTTLYGTAKHALHQVLAAAAATADVELAWGRVFFAYGPHEAPERLVPSVIAPLLRGDPAAIGDGTARRDFMHVQDVAAALVAVLASGHVGPVNIATGECRSIREVVLTIAAETGCPDLVQFGARPPTPGEPAMLAAATSVLHGLGFRPHFTIESGLADAIHWWRSRVNEPVGC